MIIETENRTKPSQIFQAVHDSRVLRKSSMNIFYKINNIYIYTGLNIGLGQHSAIFDLLP